MAANTRGAMTEAGRFTAHLQGGYEDKQRRAEMLEDLFASFGRGPEAVKENLTNRLDALDGEFAIRLDELKELL